MERKTIEAIINHCNIQQECEECFYNEECRKAGNVLAREDSIYMIPLHWSDEDIDYILDTINT